MKSFFEEIDKKKIIIMGGFFLVVIIIIFGSAFIYNRFFLKSSYEEVENNMKNAAIKYFSTNKDELPSENNESVTISDTTLVNSNLMKSVNEQLKVEGYTCNGKVIVTSINGGYRYNPVLDCGDKYQVTKLIDHINNNVSIVDSGNGLYDINGELVYRGDKVYNYIKLSDKTYRIVKIVNDEIYIIYTDKPDDANWDNRYNIDKKGKVGYNDYSISKIRDYLDNLYNGSTFLSNNDKLMINSYDVKIGSRSVNETDKTGSIENSIVLEDQYIGLLPVYDFMNASIDENCTTTTARSCVNYNYLAKFNFTWWLTTADMANSYSVYMVSGGSINSVNASKSAYVRPVLKLADDIMYVSGDGSSKNPYIIK